jgi:hypothetical protein
LKVKQVLDTFPYEYMMAAPDAFYKPQMREKPTKVIEINVRIGAAAQYLFEQLAIFRHSSMPLFVTPCVELQIRSGRG